MPPLKWEISNIKMSSSPTITASWKRDCVTEWQHSRVSTAVTAALVMLLPWKSHKRQINKQHFCFHAKCLHCAMRKTVLNKMSPCWEGTVWKPGRISGFAKCGIGLNPSNSLFTEWSEVNRNELLHSSLRNLSRSWIYFLCRVNTWNMQRLSISHLCGIGELESLHSELILEDISHTHTQLQPQNSTRPHLAGKRQSVVRIGVKQCWELKQIALKSSVRCGRRKPLWPFYYFIVSHLKEEETRYSSQGQGHFDEKRECYVWEKESASVEVEDDCTEMCAVVILASLRCSQYFKGVQRRHLHAHMKDLLCGWCHLYPNGSVPAHVWRARFIILI